MKIELAENGYETINAKILAIEDLAMAGMFTDKDTISRFQQIVSEIKQLRQTLREVLLIVPSNVKQPGEGDAA